MKKNIKCLNLIYLSYINTGKISKIINNNIISMDLIFFNSIFLNIIISYLIMYYIFFNINNSFQCISFDSQFKRLFLILILAALPTTTVLFVQRYYSNQKLKHLKDFYFYSSSSIKINLKRYGILLIVFDIIMLVSTSLIIYSLFK